jgi:hypothetical protein
MFKFDVGDNTKKQKRRKKDLYSYLVDAWVDPVTIRTHFRFFDLTSSSSPTLVPSNGHILVTAAPTLLHFLQCLALFGFWSSPIMVILCILISYLLLFCHLSTEPNRLPRA